MTLFAYPDSSRKTLGTGPEVPIRAELFSVERLEQHAESLAVAQQVTQKPGNPRRHTTRLYANTSVLVASYRAIVGATREHRSITPAAEWLLDNFHVVEEQIREIKEDLPPGFYRLLPTLVNGPLAGFPRVFGVAWALVAHTDSAFDVEKLTRFVAAYQRVQPLTIGELWAIAITLRATLIENLRRLAEAIVARLDARQQADELVDRILGADKDGTMTATTVRHSLDQAPWSSAFAVQLAQRLRDLDQEATPALRWLNERLVTEGLTTDELVRNEVQKQGNANITVRNVITSMRLISTIDWAEWFEGVSLVDATLRAESDFSAMDFSTRDLYRGAIEDLSRRSDCSEIKIAEEAIVAAKTASDLANGRKAPRGAACDPGYYLISKGRRYLERRLNCRVSFGRQLARAAASMGIFGYGGAIALISALMLTFALLSTAQFGLNAWTIVFLGIVGVVPATDVAVALVNRFLAQNLKTQILPGLELLDGVPEIYRTIVVTPMILRNRHSIEELTKRLEVHYLSNRDDSLCFALLSDWSDSHEENGADDDSLFAIASEGIERLNQLYRQGQPEDRFFLLHRRRVWNEGERKWLGWERKRGKLHELNRLLRGATDTTFLDDCGGLAGLPRAIRYVITLDSDTRMPIGTAKRLIGKMAHPLNRPRFDDRLGRVVDGHAILQPRVTPSLPIGPEGSMLQRAFSGPNGLDPYVFAASDVYQDLFGEGSFVGKGIYEIDAFERAMKGRIPESAVLSHDLLEGIYARAGLASDIELVEEFPSRYDVATARQHRWTRGDWQLLPWIFGRGRGLAGKAQRLPGIPLLSRWKMLDNLRRSLSAPAALLALIGGWLLPPGAALAWTAFILFTLVFSPFLPAIAGLVSPSPELLLRNRLHRIGRDAALGLLQSAFLIVFLAHQAWLMVDAVTRALFRQFVSRRKLLEWTTTAQSEESGPIRSSMLWGQIAASAAFAGAIVFTVTFAGYHTWPFAVPLAVLWGLSPVLARFASRPPPERGHVSVSAADAKALRLIARRTWRFFEVYITPRDNMLPPDNFQEDPEPVVAHRTSPTNMGLYLLSIVSARDFGWLGTLDMLDRLDATLQGMSKLERFRGHFFNWYDTQDLRALEPKYVSSVDSGNLAGHLIALSNACREIMFGTIFDRRWIEGLEDSLDLIAESMNAQDPEIFPPSLPMALDEVATLLAQRPTTISTMACMLAALASRSSALAALTEELADDRAADVSIWAEALRAAVHTHRRDCDQLMPWAFIVAADPRLFDLLPELPESLESLTLNCLPRFCDAALQSLDLSNVDTSIAVADLATLIHALEQSRSTARLLLDRLKTLADSARTMFETMDFAFLFDADRKLLSIGFREEDGSLDASYYDLLASEARLASFVAIAKGDIPALHWFRLGRTSTPVKGGASLISWSGSMFEYLMPSLVMRAPADSVLEQTNRLIVRRQIEYGSESDIPWGMSESEYFARDIEHTFQYSSFGVPDLGYKRALSENFVVAPYATALAAMVDPAAAVQNFDQLTKLGGRGHYGWYEAIDFTRARLPAGAKFSVIRAYMAHHQAMSLVAIGNALHGGAMRARFHAEPIVQATELLLQERVSRNVVLARAPPEHTTVEFESDSSSLESQRRYLGAHSRVPRTQLLSNGRYSVMVTAAGSGYSRWRDVAITRWREDPTCENRGAYIYLRDIHSGNIWSAGYQPSATEPDYYEVLFSEDRVEIVRDDGSIRTVLEISISPEDDAEVRRISITNHGAEEREIEVTSYVELALGRQADDLAHPAFAKLFVQTEFIPALGAILATRRRRSASDSQVSAAHLVVVEGETTGDLQFETDRANFLGRGQTERSPAAVRDGWPLTNTTGPVLDPMFSLRQRVRIPRGATARLAFWTMAAATREEVVDLADKHHDAMAYERATTLAWTHAQIQLRHLGISSSDAQLFQRLANCLLFSDPALRAAPEVIRAGARHSSALWAHGISGDVPIVLVHVSGEDDLGLVRQLLHAHEYWRLKNLIVDLVILNERAASYVQDLQGSLDAVVRMHRAMPKVADDARGTIFVLRADLVSKDVLGLLSAAARAVIRGGGHGSLAEQVNRARDFKTPPPLPTWRNSPTAAAKSPAPDPALEFFNGLGGFGANGREYVTILEGTNRTPAPWINVIANPSFGFQVSTEGSGFTWGSNSQQNQITPWSNDAVGDPPGEALYVRDEKSGVVWTATALPIREPGSPYVATHGQGYSRFAHTAHGVALDLLQFVPVDDAIKISRLTITNESAVVRQFSITAYAEWVLGASRAATAPFTMTEIDPETGVMFALNPWNNDFGEQVAFSDLAGQQISWTGDRTEFVGRHGTLAQPLGLADGAGLSNRVGAGIDPCGALQSRVTLQSGGSIEVVWFLGQAASREEARALVAKYRSADLDVVLGEVKKQWDDIAETVQVKTPDRALDILVNRWLPYQTLACRVWARAGFYQASGAYGFRDQLQDVMALCVSRPDLARAHLLRAAGRQFRAGDVQHWWLPGTGRGIRTRITDDRIWLAYVTAHYVEVSGDRPVLDEMVPFLAGPRLRTDERDAFFEPTVSTKQVSLFEHCALALDKSLSNGAHGLPLMGTGDWNDGMDSVGEGGKGESVWLGWFLYSTLVTFAPVAEQRGESDRVRIWLEHAAALKIALDQQGWDGDWYRRAYFDDGTPMGSASNSECRIDSIAQSWGVISGGADPARAQRAMEAVDKYLVRREDRLALLFTPPFERAEPDPGYIKGYPAGIRENGGQYTHGAIWSALAFAKLGDGDKAFELLSLLNPIRHSDSQPAVHRYKVEPYVVAADVYSMPPHVGRGGWTWYTGAAGWFYRVALERLLGFRLQGDNLLIDPCIPKTWPGYQISFRHRSSVYEIDIENKAGVGKGVISIKLDGLLLEGPPALIPLVDDGVGHRVQVILG